MGYFMNRQLNAFLMLSLALIYSGCGVLKSSGFANDGNGGSGRIINCPAGYVGVEGSVAMGTSDFCVMKFEAKSVAGLAVSTDVDPMWVNVDQPTAQDACTAIGTGYGLISNPEWMTIARELETNGANWSGGSVGTGCLMRGNVGISDACSYIGFNNLSENMAEAARNTKSRLLLKSGNAIWDLSGNVTEWVDFNLPNNKPYILADGVPQHAFREAQLFDTRVSASDGLPGAFFKPYTSSLTNAANGIGVIDIGWEGVGGAMLRGSQYLYGSNGGLYQMSMGDPASFSHSSVGFRCVYHP
jgi:hypothetical protein